jgi:hypothetical protein
MSFGKFAQHTHKKQKTFREKREMRPRIEFVVGGHPEGKNLIIDAFSELSNFH